MHIHAQVYLYIYISGWWFGTWLLFFHILGIVTPTVFHFFQRGGSTTNQICTHTYVYVILQLPFRGCFFARDGDGVIRLYMQYAHDIFLQDITSHCIILHHIALHYIYIAVEYNRMSYKTNTYRSYIVYLDLHLHLPSLKDGAMAFSPF